MIRGAHQRTGAALYRCPGCRRTGIQIRSGKARCAYCPYLADLGEFIHALPDGTLRTELEASLHDADEAREVKERT